MSERYPTDDLVTPYDSVPGVDDKEEKNVDYYKDGGLRCCPTCKATQKFTEQDDGNFYCPFCERVWSRSKVIYGWGGWEPGP